MTSNDSFPALAENELPPASRTLLTEQKKKHGFVAAPLARAAASPVALAALLDLLGRFESSSLPPAEREVLAFALAHANGCGYCKALHTAIGRHVPGVAPHVEGLRRGERPNDPQLGALWDFVDTVLETRGAPGKSALRAFHDAGYTNENALDVVLGIGTYTLTTFTNRLVQAPLDPPLQRFQASESELVSRAASA